jgi:hypothetical protein
MLISALHDNVSRAGMADTIRRKTGICAKGLPPDPAAVFSLR